MLICIKKKYIILELEFELRRKIVTNNFSYIVDVINFVTVVFVSELTMMLNKQNMKTFNDMIRKILHDSARFEEILNDVDF